MKNAHLLITTVRSSPAPQQT